jgi:hypothetical protein
VSHEQSIWRKLAERASTEQDPEKLVTLVEELNGALARESLAARRRHPASAA